MSLKQYITLDKYSYTLRPSRQGVRVELQSTDERADLLDGDSASTDLTWDTIEAAESRNRDAVAEWVRETIHGWRLSRLAEAK